MDCGPTCLQMISKYYGKSYSLSTLRDKSFLTREGVSLLGISQAAENIGFHTLGAKIDFEQLEGEALLPCIAHWEQEHFVVVYKLKKGIVHVADPAHGIVKYSQEDFIKAWIGSENSEGIVLFLEPTPKFYTEKDEQLKGGFKFLFSYLIGYKGLLFQLLLGLIIATILQLIAPFLTQSLVDVGVRQQNLNFIHLVLFAQLALFVGQSVTEVVRNWILLHIGARINISLIADFLAKLLMLPVSFFDTKMTGDILQRVQDHHRIESFLTAGTLTTLFSLLNLVVFGAVLAYYNLQIFIVFLLGSVFYIGWILFFLKFRKELDYKRFTLESANQSNILQLIDGLKEVKLYGAEQRKRWEWEEVQIQLFKLSMKDLSLQQKQSVGASFINQLKNIVVTVLAAKAVLYGEMTLGMLLAIQYIVGQLNSPLTQLIGFVQQAQDTSIGLERLKEIHEKPNENSYEPKGINKLPQKASIKVNNLVFHYEGPSSKPVLNDLTLEIPSGKVTAVVGASGSGKTTLLKLLLRFYEPSSGELTVDNINLDHFETQVWRNACGAVLQDGFIFSDTIANNISLSDEKTDFKKLLQASEIANIREFIENLPRAYQTKVGTEGVGLSQGQKQRLLIARAVYKDPQYLFFDEATNSLDANNEKRIVENLDNFFDGRTVVVVAHRLSTVRKADKIVVIENGKIVEEGSHSELTVMEGKYYQLVKNQLELGN